MPETAPVTSCRNAKQRSGLSRRHRGPKRSVLRIAGARRVWRQTVRIIGHQNTEHRGSHGSRHRNTKWSIVHIMQTPEGIARKTANLHKMPIEIPNRPRPENCECCGEASNKALHFDHCHDTGRFRGWCCHVCNTCHGIADNPRRLRLRALYVERPFQPGPINWAYPTGKTDQQIYRLGHGLLHERKTRMGGHPSDV